MAREGGVIHQSDVLRQGPGANVCVAGAEGVRWGAWATSLEAGGLARRAGPAPVIGGIVVLGLRVAPCRECEEIRPGDRLE